MKIWNFRTLPEEVSNVHIDANGDEAEAQNLGISPLLLRLLRLRSVVGSDNMDKFLSPNLRLLAAPQLWPGMKESAQILHDALRMGKKMAVWGDYDVDGITASAVVLDVLSFHGFDVHSHLPDRCSEGYGLNKEALDALAAQGIELLLTVDCGISDVEAVAHARSLGMTVVISDHHLPPEHLPSAHAICNPRLADCPCVHLAGVGVAFFLMGSLNSLLAESTGKRYDMRNVLDLVALGTLADVVQLSTQNRILVKNGLLKISEASRPGMAALKSVCKVAVTAKLGAGQVVFTLAPRINAAGRMGHARLALETLRAPDFDTGLALAQKLDSLNTERRIEEERIHQEARQQAALFPNSAGLVLYGEGWHPGIIGIVASRIVEEFYKPTLILCDDQQALKGSGRSVREFDLHSGLSSMAEIFLGFGGHKLAAGVKLEKDKLDLFRQRFDQVAREQLGEGPITPSLTLDAELDFATASDATFLRELELMQPFGPGNAEPVFASPPLIIRDRRTFGYHKEHVILDVTDEKTGITLHAKAWRKAAEFPDSVKGQKIRLAYTPRIDTYNGADSVDVRIRDWQWV